MGAAGSGKAAGALRGAGKGIRWGECAAASLGEHRPAASDSYANADADTKPNDFPKSFHFTDADSIFQRNAVTDIAPVDSPHIRVSHPVAVSDRDALTRWSNPSSRAKSRDPAELTFKLAHRDPSTSLGMTALWLSLFAPENAY